MPSDSTKVWLVHKPPKENFFDHMRLFAAWLVFFSHHHALFKLPEPGSIFGSMGHVGVGIFFSLSGYLVTHSIVSDPHPGRFMARRILRIVPGLTVNVLICAFILGPLLSKISLSDYWVHPDTWRYFTNLLFSPRFSLPGVFVDNPYPYAVNGSLWTLPFEFLAYFCLCALIFVVGIKRHARVAFMLWSLTTVIALVWHPKEAFVFWGNDLRYAPTFLTLFFAGTMLATWGEQLLKTGYLLGLITSLLILSMSFAGVSAFASLVLLPLLTIYYASGSAPSRYAVRNDCSFGIYIYAFPIQQTTISVLGHWGFWPTLIIAGVLTYLFALLSWVFIERPALRLKPHAPAKSTIPTAVAS